MGNQVTVNHFYPSYTEEPHASRRREILRKYPQVKSLYGIDPGIKWQVLWWWFTQLVLAVVVAPALGWPWLIAMAWSYGGLAAHSLFLAMHEISHNLAFNTMFANKVFGIFTNLITVFPHFSMFQKYHMEHHQFQGVDGIDVDVPSSWEGTVFRNSLAKVVWVFFQPVFYITRPLLVKPKVPTISDISNWAACIVFGALLYYFFGAKTLMYLQLSGVLGAGLHPVAGHFIAEHYVFNNPQETYSYYGFLNVFSFNVGYHNEHHDFPRIPGSRLHKLHEMAPEYYDTLPSHGSWVRVIWNYITDPRLGPYSRVVRAQKKFDHKSDDDM